MSKQPTRAVFLDRDGTIARDVPYCRRIEDFDILPGAPEGIRLLNECGFKVVVVTNQSGIARGYFTEETLARIHQKMRDDLSGHGARIDSIYFCPHHPDEGCGCRKPGPALLLQAAGEMDVELKLSYMVGDDPKDLEAGRAAGCKTLLVTTGPNRGDLQRKSVTPDYVAVDLYEAARWIAGDSGLAVG
jgi:histidinol-phosphate phosphatase family protein